VNYEQTSDQELAIEAAKAVGQECQISLLGQVMCQKPNGVLYQWSPATDANQAIELAEHVEQTMSLRSCVDHFGSHGQYNVWFVDATTGWKPDSSLDVNGIAASFARAMMIACLKTVTALKAHAALTTQPKGDEHV
jgi:hypothetical protein